MGLEKVREKKKILSLSKLYCALIPVIDTFWVILYSWWFNPQKFVGWRIESPICITPVLFPPCFMCLPNRNKTRTPLCPLLYASKPQHGQLRHTLCDRITRITVALTSYVASSVSQTNLPAPVGWRRILPSGLLFTIPLADVCFEEFLFCFRLNSEKSWHRHIHSGEPSNEF